ncbi:hypothetical protein [uncultured Parasphingorhabdus sp.]|uniref:hypothetical protein n=1 Tax=uncultured Parasphingorhabdus sp. TaxID=2709694 RepID=UPI0030D9EB20|tara:strand:- start:3895 stop:4314 length:420 start_codon:yes stop_codon:yes gene_type:complete
MGRSVSYPTGAITAYQFIEAGDDHWDLEYEAIVENIIHQAKQAFPSLNLYNGWRGREDRILLRNAFADFGISVYCGLAAIWITARDDNRYWDKDSIAPLKGRTDQWLSQIEARFLVMFSHYRCIGRFSNGEAIYEPVSG